MTIDTTRAEPAWDTTRFSFGENWARFLQVLNDDRIAQAQRSLERLLGVESLAGTTFVDVGSGSGLFSLSARRLGAQVTSFDFDQQSVACTAELRRRHSPADDPAAFPPGDRTTGWKVERGSALDADYLRALGSFDTVYSWGVLHHTGSMWKALDLIRLLTRPGGRLVIALYNDQGRSSRMWTHVKRSYNRLPTLLQPAAVAATLPYLWGPTALRTLVRRGNVKRVWNEYGQERGMSAWNDAVDWVGGYPFEVAQREEVVSFYEARGWSLVRLTSVGDGLGCNEFVFERSSSASATPASGHPTASQA